MSFVAFSIDAILPALGVIGDSFNILDPNENQNIITSIFLGLAMGQLIYGPIADSVGRKPTIYIGFSFFLIGSLICIFSTDMSSMLVGRVLQGFGLSANRIACVAIIRDVFGGNEMAKVMSFIMTVFIIVPTLAPSLGHALMYQGEFYKGRWQNVFVFLLMFTTIVTVWFAFKQNETLEKDKRSKLSLKKTGNVIVEVFQNRQALSYTIISGFVLAGFMTYLSLAQQIFQIQYQKTETFPYYFALIAIFIGLASFLNGKFVKVLGMFKIVDWALRGIVLFSGISILYTFLIEEPSFTVFLLFLLPIMFCIGLLFGNLNSIAMEPLGRVAGTGASVVGSVSTFISVPISFYIGGLYSNSIYPLIIGFLVLSVLSMIIVKWVKYKDKKVLVYNS